MSRPATAGGCTIGFSIGWNIGSVGAIADTIDDDYGVSLATAGLFTTALFASHTLLQIPAGRSVDKLGARRVGLVALALLAAANGLALLAPEPALVLALRALAGAGTALGFVAGSDYVRTHGGSPLAQGVYGGVALGAGGVALALVPQLEHLVAWRAPFWSGLALAGAGAIALAAGPRDGPRRSLPVGRRALGAPGLVRDARLLGLGVIYMASFGLAVALGTWVVPFLTRAGDYSTGLAGAIGALVLAAGVVSRPLGGWIGREHPGLVPTVLTWSCLACAGAAALLGLAGPPALSAIAALVVGFASGIPFALTFGAAARVRPDAPAAAVGVVNMAANLLVVGLTPLLGLAFSLPGDGRVGFLAAAALPLAALAFVGATRIEPAGERPAG
ncbi:MAG: MFS transporter [Thermoleophilia bacterium]|nr:MFS transporter [Thermoleophilia bacterium]